MSTRARASLTRRVMISSARERWAPPVRRPRLGGCALWGAWHWHGNPIVRDVGEQEMLPRSGTSARSRKLRRSLRSSRRIQIRGFVVKHSGRPRKKILGVRRIVARLVHRVACVCANGVQRCPPTQCDDFTAIRVEISHGDSGTKISGCVPITCYSGRADVLYIGGFLWAPNFRTPFAKYRH
jgi:hypothetical protein